MTDGFPPNFRSTIIYCSNTQAFFFALFVITKWYNYVLFMVFSFIHSQFVYRLQNACLCALCMLQKCVDVWYICCWYMCMYLGIHVWLFFFFYLFFFFFSTLPLESLRHTPHVHAIYVLTTFVLFNWGRADPVGYYWCALINT